MAWQYGMQENCKMCMDIGEENMDNNKILNLGKIGTLEYVKNREKREIG